MRLPSSEVTVVRLGEGEGAAVTVGEVTAGEVLEYLAPLLLPELPAEAAALQVAGEQRCYQHYPLAPPPAHYHEWHEWRC